MDVTGMGEKAVSFKRGPTPNPTFATSSPTGSAYVHPLLARQPLFTRIPKNLRRQAIVGLMWGQRGPTLNQRWLIVYSLCILGSSLAIQTLPSWSIYHSPMWKWPRRRKWLAPLKSRGHETPSLSVTSNCHTVYPAKPRILSLLPSANTAE